MDTDTHTHTHTSRQDTYHTQHQYPPPHTHMPPMQTHADGNMQNHTLSHCTAPWILPQTPDPRAFSVQKQSPCLLLQAGLRVHSQSSEGRGWKAPIREEVTPIWDAHSSEREPPMVPRGQEFPPPNKRWGLGRERLQQAAHPPPTPPAPSSPQAGRKRKQTDDWLAELEMQPREVRGRPSMTQQVPPWAQGSLCQ